MSSSKQFCTFYLDEMLFGIDVMKIQEVIRFQPMTSIPLAPRTVRGLINLRGQIVTALDLRRQLNMADRSDNLQFMNVVVRSNDGAVSLLVDEIGDVLEVDETTREEPPENLDPTTAEMIKGVYKLDSKLLLEMNTAKAVQFAT